MATDQRAADRERVATAIRFPKDVLASLHEAADDRDLSVNYLVVKAVEDFLRRLIPAEEFRLTRSS